MVAVTGGLTKYRKPWNKKNTRCRGEQNHLQAAIKAVRVNAIVDSTFI